MPDKQPLILALDLGTTGNRAIAFNKAGNIVASDYEEFTQHFPKPGWVEHDPMAIASSAVKVLKAVISRVGTSNIVSMGITNQRETTVIWDRESGKPVYNAIVWQDRRTTELCQTLTKYRPSIKQKTGLLLDPYFSGTKIQWILENVTGLKSRLKKGKLAFGTIDSWILWYLTGGRNHASEPSNLSRTLLFNIHKRDYDDTLLSLFRVPRSLLPRIQSSDALFGHTKPELCGASIPIRGILGDQQAALFAQSGWEQHALKNTYGTGLFLIASTGHRVPECESLINTIAWDLGGQCTYALEGSIFTGGAALQWLRDELTFFKSASDSQALAETITTNDGVYFVPALTGLGAPFWDPTARGLLIGLTRGTTKAHITRAALESLAYQTKDVVEYIQSVNNQDSPFTTLRVDGGASQNDFLMQFQADILNMTIERPDIIETTGFGVAGVSGIASQVWSIQEFAKCRRVN